MPAKHPAAGLRGHPHKPGRNGAVILAMRRVPVSSSSDIVTARQQGRELSEQIGFTGSDLTLIATAISEIARNVVAYAGRGELVFKAVQQGLRHGLEVTARDSGPGIADLGKALQPGFSTGKGLGLGLPGARRLMDEFEVQSIVRKGTTVVMKKWAPP